MMRYPETREVPYPEITKPLGDSTGEEMLLSPVRDITMETLPLQRNYSLGRSYLLREMCALSPCLPNFCQCLQCESQLVRRHRRSHPHGPTSRKRHWLSGTDSI